MTFDSKNPACDPPTQDNRAKLQFREVPAYEITEFAPRRTKYCFVPIVYNEGERFRRQLTEMSLNAHLADILVAERRSNDGCTDPDFLKSKGVRALLTTDTQGGAASIRVGLDYALAQGYEGVILIDGNEKDGPKSLPEYIKKLDEGYDFVQGSRFMKGGIERNTPLARKIGIRFVMGPLLWLGSGFWYTDATDGFRGYSLKFLTDPRVEPLRSCFNHFNIQYFLSRQAPALGFRTVEIPVARVYPDDGSVPTKVTGFKRNFLAFWEMVLAIAGYYNLPKT